jgi:RNA polymerase sigma-70 factor (ECF subfamily)
MMSRIDERIEDEELRALLPRLRRFALSLVHEPISADELVRTCLEHALSRRRVRETSTSLRSWLFAILYRQFLDLRHRGRRWRRLLAAIYPEADRDRVVERWITGPALAFARLSVENRALLLMVTVEGFTYQETALVLAIPATSVLPRLLQARQVYQHLSEGMRVVAPLRRVK